MKFRIVYNKKSESYFIKKRFWFGWLYKGYGDIFSFSARYGSEFSTITNAEDNVKNYIHSLRRRKKVETGEEILAKELSI